MPRAPRPAALVAACLMAALLPAVSGPGGELPTEGLILYDQGYSAFESEVDASGTTAFFSVRFF